jgi:Mg/Co/Ni transporter MgtE
VARRTRAAGWRVCIVVDEDRVVLGRLEALDGDPSAVVMDVMRSAPTTVRPHLTLEKVLALLESRRREHVLVTTSDGRLVGLLRRADAQQRLSRVA